MTNLAPISVALKFGFLAVLYVFLLWIARSAMHSRYPPLVWPRTVHPSPICPR